MLEKDFRGIVKNSGIVESDLGAATYSGVLVTTVGTVAVLIGEHGKEFFAPGQTVTFRECP